PLYCPRVLRVGAHKVLRWEKRVWQGLIKRRRLARQVIGKAQPSVGSAKNEVAWREDVGSETGLPVAYVSAKTQLMISLRDAEAICQHKLVRMVGRRTGNSTAEVKATRNGLLEDMRHKTECRDSYIAGLKKGTAKPVNRDSIETQARRIDNRGTDQIGIAHRCRGTEILVATVDRRSTSGRIWLGDSRLSFVPT